MQLTTIGIFFMKAKSSTIKHSFFSSSPFTERHGQMVNTPARIQEVPGSNIGPKTGYPD
jgi:hypothetical protein